MKDYYGFRGYAAAAPPLAFRRTQRQVKPRNAAFYGAVAQPRRAFGGPQYQGLAVEAPCPPGTRRNPQTRRCVKIGGRVNRQVFGLPQQPRQPQQRLRRTLSAGPASLPHGESGVISLSDPHSWLTANCSNATALHSASPATLQEIVSLHNRTCISASDLNTAVVGRHKAGKIALIPGTEIPLTPADYDALRAAQRRRNPAYKLPPLRHAPPPAEWKLYVAQDARSGRDYVTVAFVDITKARPTQTGYVYDDHAIRVPLGFIPARTQQAQRIVNLLGAVQDRLLAAAPGGWRSAISSLPAEKSVWNGAEGVRRLNRLIKELETLRDTNVTVIE